MKITNKKRLSKKAILIIIVIFLLLLTLGFISYTYTNNIFHPEKSSVNQPAKSNVINYGPATNDQKNAGTQVKTGTNEAPSSPTSIPNSDKKYVETQITAVNQNSSILQIRTLIGIIDSTGTCTLTMTSEGQSTITKTANTQPLASTSTCQGFDIPMSELSVGTWHIVIDYTSDKLIGTASQDKVLK